MSRPVTIYALLDDHSMIRYVGKTVSPGQRINVHKKQKAWLCSVQILEVTDENHWIEREKYWILYGQKNGWPLENLRSGGTPVASRTPEATREKQRIAAIQDWENRRRRGWKYPIPTAESNEKRRLAQIGRKASDADRQAMREAWIKRKETGWRSDRVHTPESNRMRSLTQLGKPKPRRVMV